MQYLLDTCAIIFVAENASDLSAATLKLLDAAAPGEVSVSAISLAELACLQERGRIQLKQHWRSWWTSCSDAPPGFVCLSQRRLWLKLTAFRNRSTAIPPIEF